MNLEQRFLKYNKPKYHHFIYSFCIQIRLNTKQGAIRQNRLKDNLMSILE